MALRADLSLRRLLHILPSAAGEGGMSLRVLAEELDVTPGDILRDIEAVTNRVFYQRGGWVDNIRVEVESDIIRVVVPGGFERPNKLNARETLCLAIGLRSLGASSFADAHLRKDLLQRVDRFLSSADVRDLATDAISVADDRPDEAGIVELLLTSARGRAVVEILYLSRPPEGGRRRVEKRAIEPCVMARSEGQWYAIAWCRKREGFRAFRADRIVSAWDIEESFESRDDFHASQWIEEGRVYRGGDETLVRIRYAPSIARFVREEAQNHGLPIEECDSGAIIVDRSVADWDWVVTHALGYGGEAEILSPPELRGRVREVLRGITRFSS